MKKLRYFAPLLLLCALAVLARAADYNLACVEGTQLKACTDGAKLKPTKTIALAAIPVLDVSHLPTGIPAPSIGGGTVTNSVFGYIANLTSDAQGQLDAKQAISADLAALAAFGSTLGIPQRTAATPTWSLLTPAAGMLLYGSSASTWAGLPFGPANALLQSGGAGAPSWVSSLTGITISGGANTLTNIGNSSLTNSSISLACTGLSGCGSVSLGGIISPSVVYGSSASTSVQGNDSRVPATPSGVGGTLYDSGTAWVRLAAGTANYLYQANGAGAPSWVNSLTGISISGSSNTLSDIANSSLVNSSVTLSCTGLSGCGSVALGATLSPAVSYGSTANTAVQGNDPRVPAAPSAAGGTLYDTGSAWARLAAGTANYIYQSNGAGAPSWVSSISGISHTGSYTLGGTPTLGANLAAGSNKITGLAAATTSGDALSYPWITDTTATGTLSAASYSLTTNAFEDIGLSVSLGAGKHRCTANVRNVVNCSVGSGYIVLEFYDATAAAAIASSERIGALCSVVATSYTDTTPIDEIVTVSTTSTLKVYAKSPAGFTYNARDIYSDADGRSRLTCVKVGP